MKANRTKIPTFCGVILFIAFLQSALATPHYVFAHYMVCFATYGDTLEGYQREIREAQAAGLDGFALNVGAWDDVQGYYKTRVGLLYAAAEQLGTGFKLFFSVDYPGLSNVVDMVSQYANRTATFKYQGKTVLSSYGQNDVPSTGVTGIDWTNTVLPQLAAQGIGVFFIPHFWPDPVRELPGYADARAILQKYGDLLGGLFLFGAAGLPEQLAQCNSNYTRAVHQAGKVFMASVTPHYWGCFQPSIGRRYFETYGGEGLALQWTSILTNQPDWVEITTWNDWNESTYISPVTDPGQYFVGAQTPTRFSHSGYLELSKHYIAWFKSGVEPVLDTDCLFYFYRTHNKSTLALSTNDVPVSAFFGDVQDTLYSTIFLTQSASLEIHTGNRAITNMFSAGWHHLRMPWGFGSQKFTLVRSGFPLLSIQGPDIKTQILAYDFFPASGFAYYKPAPPTNVRATGP